MSKAQPFLCKFLVESSVPQMPPVPESNFVGVEAADVGSDGLGWSPLGPLAILLLVTPIECL